MGYDEVHCAFTSFSLGHITMTCPYGTMGKIMLNGVGINPYTANNRRLCKGASNKATEFHHENKSLDIDERTKTNTMCRKFVNDHGILFG